MWSPTATMKFERYLKTEITPEWREYYLDYNQLKRIANNCRRGMVDVDIFELCHFELEKINAFFERKIGESNRKWLALEWAATPRDSVMLKQAGPTEKGLWKIWQRITNFARRRPPPSTLDVKKFLPHLSINEVQNMRKAAEEFYCELKALQGYQKDNDKGFKKIMRKYDRATKHGTGDKWYEENVPSARFFVEKSVDNLIDRVVELRIRLEGGNRDRAMEKLYIPATADYRKAGVACAGGFFWACFIDIMLITATYCWYSSDWWHPPWVIIRLYRMPFQILLHFTLVAINMVIWHRNNVNYVLTFELDPRRHLASCTVFSIAAFGWMLWALSILGYVTAPWLNRSRLWFPLILVIVYVLLVFNPFSCYRESRYWTLQRIFYCATAPFRNGTFPDFWFACQMVSESRLFQDVHYFVCFYATQVRYSNGSIYLKVNNKTAAVEMGIKDFVYDTSQFSMDPRTGSDFCSSDKYGIRPVMRLLPYYVRVSQCFRRYWLTKQFFPHFINGIKYSLMAPEVIFESLYKVDLGRMLKTSKPILSGSPFLHLWMLACVARYTFNLVWDVRIDWKLFNSKPGHNLVLRQRLMYGHGWLYYLGMAAEYVTRMTWAFRAALYKPRLGSLESEHMSTAIAVIEILRRFVWNIFRVENEHLHNVDGLRVTRNIRGVPFKKVRHFGTITKRMKAAEKNTGENDGSGESKSTKSAETRS